MALRVLIVDDEALARSRLRVLLGDCTQPPVAAVAEAGNAVQAMDALQRLPWDLVLLDIRMPGVDGLALARTLRQLPKPPAVVFVTAHQEHAVQAFDLDAVDYLTKPVRLERLQTALQKVQRMATPTPVPLVAPEAEVLTIQDRGRTERVALDQVLYFKAELKYVTVRTESRSYILDASLGDLETRYAQDFLRVHRNALVARRRLRVLEKSLGTAEGEGWTVRLAGLAEPVAVSRRQLAAVRAAMQG